MTGKDVEMKSESGSEHPESVKKALQVLHGLDGLIVEIRGDWIWVSGDTKKNRKVLKSANYKYAGKKKMWYFKPKPKLKPESEQLTTGELWEPYDCLDWKSEQLRRRE